MVPHYYRNVHAVVFVYDVTKVRTFLFVPVILIILFKVLCLV